VGHELSLTRYFFLYPGGHFGFAALTFLFGTPGLVQIISFLAFPTTFLLSVIEVLPVAPPGLEVTFPLIVTRVGGGAGAGAGFGSLCEFEDGEDGEAFGVGLAVCGFGEISKEAKPSRAL
jgi:hypothetical protein